MCITSEDIRSEEEAMVWDILCHECNAKAGTLLDERKVLRLFDVDIEEYGFCSKCTGEIKDTFERLEKAEFGGDIP
jgi:hypothetical protein